MLPQSPFYLIRHGQSTANARQITAGGLFDSPLTDMGRHQAHTLSAYLKDHMMPMPGRIYHSTMVRARDTAHLLNQGLGLDMVPDFELREHDMGAWDGLPWDVVVPELRANKAPPGGETTDRFATRIRTVIEKIIRTHDNDENPPMIVAHGGLFHAIGFLYQHAITNVENCHLHYFEPAPAQNPFPWRVWQFDIEGGSRLSRRLASFNI